MPKFHVRFGAPIELFGEMVTEVETSDIRRIETNDKVVAVSDWTTQDGLTYPCRRAVIWPPPGTSTAWYDDAQSHSG